MVNAKEDKMQYGNGKVDGGARDGISGNSSFLRCSNIAFIFFCTVGGIKGNRSS